MRQSIYFLLILFAFTACKKDDDVNSSSGTPTPPATSYENPQLSGTNSSADFFGRITNQNGDNIEGALVEVGNKTALTNSFGFYEINNALVDQDYAVVKVTAPSYFKQFRSFAPKASSVNMQDIQLIPLVYSGVFQSETGGPVQLQGGGQVIFQAGDLMNQDGSAYSGQVVVASAYLDPSDPALPSYLPGSLLAVDTDDELAVMITYGMMGVELYGSSGQLLQLADGMEASLEMPIQTEQMAFAPESIPLWFFDETNGIWREDGVATKTGNKYVGEVSHFTFWNCDVPADWSHLEGTVIFDGDTYNQNSFYIKVVRPDGTWALGFVNNDGTFSGPVPSNESLEIYFVIPQCSSEEYYTTIAPIGIGETYDLGQMELNQISTLDLATFTATIVDCEGAPQSGLIVDFEYGGQQIYSVSNSEGQIDVVIPCIDGSQPSYVIIDTEEATQSILGEINFTPVAGSYYDLGELPYCDTQLIGEYFAYTEGTNQVFMVDLDVYQFETSFLRLRADGVVNTADSMRTWLDVPTAVGPGEYFGGTELHMVSIQLENGNIYKAYFQLGSTSIFFNEIEFESGGGTVLEKFDITFSGDADVFIYPPNGENPINQYTANATCHYHYWPE